MLVWLVGIGPHVCLVSNSSKCASCLCLAHGPAGHALLACMGVPCWAPLCLCAALQCMQQASPGAVMLRCQALV